MKDVYISGEPQEIEFEDVYSDSSFNESPPQKQKQKKKKHRLRKIILVCLIIIIVPAVIIGVAALFSDYTRTDLKNNEYISSTQLNSSPFVTNILLLGTDEESGGTSRSDSMILLSLDFLHGKIKLTSFLRDCQVDIPSTGKKMKLNAACVYGGAQLVRDTIEYNFRVKINHYIKVDFEMFTKIIDELGGIDVEVTQKEADFINRTTRQTIQSGENVHLNGDEALVYARIRKLDSDYMRTYRQRKIVSALIDKFKHTSPFSLFRTVNSVLPLLETDLSAAEISVTSYKGLFAALKFDILQTKMPKDDMMTTGYSSSQWVEFPDLDKCREGIYEFIYKASDEE